MSAPTHVSVPVDLFDDLLDIADDTVGYAAESWDWKYDFSARWKHLLKQLVASGVELPDWLKPALEEKP